MDVSGRRASTIASAIEINRPVNLTKCLRALEICDGVVREVSDQEILDAKAQVGAGGFGCEPASAASVAGAKLWCRRRIIGRDERVVCILTGHQLKDPTATVAYHTTDQEKFNEVLGSRGVKRARSPIAPWQCRTIWTRSSRRFNYTASGVLKEGTGTSRQPETIGKIQPLRGASPLFQQAARIMIRIAIHGAAGRMGQRLVALAQADPDLKVAAAIEAPSHPRLGQDAGAIAGVGPIGVPLAAKLEGRWMW